MADDQIIRILSLNAIALYSTHQSFCENVQNTAHYMYYMKRLKEHSQIMKV